MICSPFKKKNFGFTLIELLIVIAIIAILTTFGAASYSRIQKGSRDTQRKADLAQVRSALEQFYSDFDRYPNSNAGTITDAYCHASSSGSYGASLVWGQAGMLCATDTSNPTTTEKTYLHQLPNNPRGNAYFYSTTGQTYCLGVILETVATGISSCGTSSGLNYVVTSND